MGDIKMNKSNNIGELSQLKTINKNSYTDYTNELWILVDKLFYDILNEFEYQDEIEPYLKDLRKFMYKEIT